MLSKKTNKQKKQKQKKNKSSNAETIYKEKKNSCFVFFESLEKKANKFGFELSISSYKLTLSR